ncbi:hypothetical protein HPB49_023923 [Dermacentor silvarum]|uniref:Uncharacterized protein n=1 Tax=Dermacentor silvarum TaxID=543639 RepID=A0ACB8DH32_DERSI|nr:hypothetical protein HPB49_023923 [Dermacentor silvarum]
MQAPAVMASATLVMPNLAIISPPRILMMIFISSPGHSDGFATQRDGGALDVPTVKLKRGENECTNVPAVLPDSAAQACIGTSALPLPGLPSRGDEAADSSRPPLGDHASELNVPASLANGDALTAAPLENWPGVVISKKTQVTLTPKRPRRSFASPLGGAAGAWQTAQGGTYNSPEFASSANLLCANSDCTEHVARLSLDPSPGTEPCDDFGAFVCSGWRSKRHHPLATSVVSEVIFQWLDSVGGRPEAYGDAIENNSASTLLRRPAELMDACMRVAAQSDAKADLLEFRKFMAALGLPWQTEELSYSTNNYSAPLRALVDLAFRNLHRDAFLRRVCDVNPSPLPILVGRFSRLTRLVTVSTDTRGLRQLFVGWNLPLWFRLDVIPPDVYRSRKRTLYMTPSPMAELSDRLESLLLASGATYASYLRLFNDTLLNARDGPKPAPSFISFWRAAPLPKSKKTDWVRILQGSIRAFPSLTVEDSLTLSDKELLKAANTLFVAYSPRDILYNTSWWLLQLMGPLVSDELFSLIYAHNHGKTLLRTSCAVQLEATYNVLLVAMSESSFDDVERLSVERHLQEVRTVALERLSYAGGLAAGTKRSLTSVLEKTNTVVWQEQFQFQSSWDRLARMYGNGYGTKDRSFFARWLADRVHFQESLATDERVAMATTFRLDASHVTSHNPASQAIAVSVAALQPPFYYTRGTSAMLYGGLGFLFAREIFQMLSSTAELLNRMDGWPRRPGAQPGSGDAAALWESFFSCPYSIDKGVLYPELPALHVAYGAYTRFRNSSTDTPLMGLEGYSPEQVFFLTFCHATCEVDSSGRLTSQYCSDAVKNFAPFAVAFSCASGSEMNIDERCEYV